MSGAEKAEVLVRVAYSGLPKGSVLRQLGVPRSTYYRWLKRKDHQGLEDHPGRGNPPWNRLASQEIERVLWSAREMPKLSCRQLAAWTTDNTGFSVSESTVYRILRREWLVKRAEMGRAAGKEYHHKTTGPHQMWATDASYFRVVGWGYYYLVTVMDGYSRFILAHRLQRDMSSDSLIEVLQEAVETNGKLERYHQTLKRDVNQLPYEMPLDLEAALVAFVSYYNYRRYHKALGNVTPSDVLKGRRQEILRRRKEVQAQTIERRRQHNRALRELTRPQSDP